MVKRGWGKLVIFPQQADALLARAKLAGLSDPILEFLKLCADEQAGIRTVLTDLKIADHRPSTDETIH